MNVATNSPTLGFTVPGLAVIMKKNVSSKRARDSSTEEEYPRRRPACLDVHDRLLWYAFELGIRGKWVGRLFFENLERPVDVGVRDREANIVDDASVTDRGCLFPFDEGFDSRVRQTALVKVCIL